MRTLSGLAFLLCGCQLLPQTEVPCANTDRCGSSSTQPPPEMVQSPFVLGQPDDKTNWLVSGMSAPQGVAIVGTKLLVADTQNMRVLIWNSLPEASGQPADYVLGQAQVSSQSFSNIYYLSSALLNPKRIASDGTHLAVSSDDSQNNRLVFYNTFPSTNNARNDFYIDPMAAPGAAGPRIFNGASPLFTGGHLYVADRGFNRLLLWNSAPTASADASLAIGQADLTSGAPNPSGVTAGGFNAPEGAPSSDGTQLYVSDTKNHRVLVWDSLPTTNMAATRVLGQADPTMNTANRNGAPSLLTMNEPVGLSVSGTRLAVTDRGNHRVLLWNNRPTTNGQTADIVLGQSTPSGKMANQGGVSGSVLNLPNSVATDGTHVAVADTNNHRVLVWNSWPVSNGQAADLVLGQSAMNQNLVNGRFASADRFLFPSAVTRAGNRLVVADRDAHRVVLWSRLPTSATEEPTLVLGQVDFSSRQSNAGVGSISPLGFDTPNGVSSDGNVLAVADTHNNRILIWSTLPTTNQQPPDVVIGQPDMMSDMYNNGGGMSGLDTPNSVFVRGGRIYVADGDNDRVLIWKSIPTQNHQPADIELGQANFNDSDPNRGGGVQAGGLTRPMFASADDSHIYVSDSNNARVLVWNTLDPTNGQAADLVLGQSDFSGGAHNLTPDAKTIGTPIGIDVFNGGLYICDFENNRIAIYNSQPTASGATESALIGQTGFSSNSPNFGGLSSASVQAPSGIVVSEVGIYIADSGNSRILVLPPPQ